MPIPSLKTLPLATSWSLIILSDDEAFLTKAEHKLESKLKPYLNYAQKTTIDFKATIQIQSVYFLVGFFTSEKKVVILSARGSRELIWADELAFDHPLTLWVKRVQLIPAEQTPLPIDIITADLALPDFSKTEWQPVQDQTKKIAEKLIHEVNDYRLSLFEQVSDFGLNLTAQFDLFRVHILKFLAILPSLDHDKGREVKRVLSESLRRLLNDNHHFKANNEKNKTLPKQYELALLLTSFAVFMVPWFILAPIVRLMVKMMAKRFIAGENIEKSLVTLSTLALTKRDATLDQLGELVVSEKEAHHYEEQVIKIIKGLSQQYKKHEANQAGINRAHVSIKVSALSSVFKPEAFDFTYDRVAPKLKRILLAAQEEAVFVNIDAEHYHYRDLVFKIYSKVLLETTELKNYSQTGIVIQCYLRDAYNHLQEVIELARKRNLTMPVRLVKGAYWDAETIEARAHSFVAPQFLNKEETDIHFKQIIYTVLKNYPHVQLAVASHNIEDHAFSEALREKHFSQTPIIEHQCLHMTYEALSTGLAKMGWPTRNYMPIGNLLVGMAYLVRRIMENSSQVGILSQMRSSKKIENLVSPFEKLYQKKREQKTSADWILNLSAEFININPVRLYVDEERELFFQAYQYFLKNSLGQHFQNGFNLSGEKKNIYCPSNPELFVGSIQWAEVNDVKKAIELFKHSSHQESWKNNDKLRINSLLKTADLLLYERYQLAFLIVYEAGKTFTEALADVDEAIDFLNFYAREEAKLQSKKNKLTLEPLGMVAVIAPWNFPLAIPCGMAAGALVAGNQVILKSAEQTPLICARLVQLFHAAGIPEDILLHMPGVGETVGKTLVDDERIRAVIFTGSKAVGEQIYKTLTKTGRKAITEMGGKNAVIVTANAELDETVSGILYGAFAHAGQKCSAASRIIAHESIIDKLGERLKEALLDIKVGESFDPSVFINPLINIDEKARIQENVRAAKLEAQKSGGKVLVDRTQEKFTGSITGPALIRLDINAATKKDSFARKELFGPVLHLIPYENLNQAIKLFNITEYGLTGGIYGQSQDDIDYLLKHLEAGNLYVNRPNTGARVGIEPFGGFKMSGTGPKAGSPEYVKIFHQERKTIDLMAAGSTPVTMDARVDITSDSTLDLVDSPFHLKQKIEVALKLLNYQNPDFIHWLNADYEKMAVLGRPNTLIPGQVSVNHYECHRKYFVVLSDYIGPNPQVLLSMVMGLLAQTKITVLVTTQDGYNEWVKVINFFHLAGFTKGQIDLSMVSSKGAEKILYTPEVELFYLDIKNPYPNRELLMNRKFDLNMPVVFDNVQAKLTDMDLYFEQFILVRSFAINTMRHGAPLEIN